VYTVFEPYSPSYPLCHLSPPSGINTHPLGICSTLVFSNFAEKKRKNKKMIFFVCLR
jgi:hypothetical protein